MGNLGWVDLCLGEQTGLGLSMMEKLLFRNFVPTVVGALALLCAPSIGQAATVAYAIDFLDDNGAAVLSGEFRIDDSRLTPNTFTPFRNDGFVSLEISTGTDVLTEAPNGDTTDLGVLTDASGEVVTFHNTTGGTQLNFINVDQLRVVEANGDWFLFRNRISPPALEGPTYTFSRIAPVPAPAAGLLALSGVLLFGVAAGRRWRRKRF